MELKSGSLRFKDADVRWRVESYLRSKHFSPVDSLEIDVDHGVVTITGSVASDLERQVLLRSCSRVAGVLQMIDRLDVRQPNSRYRNSK